MSATGSLLAVLLLGVAARDRPSVADVPPVDRPAKDFYNALAAGSKGVQTEWAADPPTVPVNGELTLTLTVRHAANPHELREMAAKTPPTVRLSSNSEMGRHGPSAAAFPVLCAFLRIVLGNPFVAPQFWGPLGCSIPP